MINPESSNDEHVAWGVTQCECGLLTLRMGATRIDLSPSEFAQLHRLLALAMLRFQVPASEAFVHEPTGLAH